MRLNDAVFGLLLVALGAAVLFAVLASLTIRRDVV